MKSKIWVLLILLTILIKFVSWYPYWVELNYTRSIYPYVSKIQRFLFGWIPISIGDIFYIVLIIIVVYKASIFFRLLFQRKLNRKYFILVLQQGIFIFLFLYVTFNLLWGLNYNRKGIAYQLNLEVRKYTTNDLDTLTTVLLERVNKYAASVNVQQRDTFNRKKKLFSAAAKAYVEAGNQYPFLRYKPMSVKPSMFSYLGNYLGFQGYYNPFSGEAQVNTTIPLFLEPYVTTHEIAHQLGYAKESEANFVAFLACRSFDNDAFRYSLYYDLFHYAIVEVYRRDTALGRSFQERLHLQVKKDRQAYREFYNRYKNPIEPIIMWGYGEFLKANNQPAGKMSYNEVVAWLIAYYKKFGIAEL
ncbi:MAG: DUF3810 domain-containing protein [Chitinophagaceae bacterium]|nr:DUF3810 domain-containing protein [Chitinophagaceae bacterium]